MYSIKHQFLFDYKDKQWIDIQKKGEELVPYSSASKNIELTYAQRRRLPSGDQENHSQLLIKSTALIKYTLLITYN